jgi:hypothetical protein
MGQSVGQPEQLWGKGGSGESHGAGYRSESGRREPERLSFPRDAIVARMCPYCVRKGTHLSVGGKSGMLAHVEKGER